MQKLIDKYRAELEELKKEQTETRKRMPDTLDKYVIEDLTIKRAELRGQMSALFDVIIDLEREEIDKWL